MSREKTMLGGAAELKRLQSQHNTLVLDVKEYELKLKQLTTLLKEKKRQLKEMDQRIEKLTQEQEHLIVSEHAIVQYLLRVYALDLESICREIVPEALEDQIKLLGNGKYPAGDHRLVVKDNVVVTVYENERSA
jgi:CII-binding regulator of phage lambda lysogenization HflD